MTGYAVAVPYMGSVGRVSDARVTEESLNMVKQYAVHWKCGLSRLRGNCSWLFSRANLLCPHISYPAMIGYNETVPLRLEASFRFLPTELS